MIFMLTNQRIAFPKYQNYLLPHSLHDSPPTPLLSVSADQIFSDHSNIMQ